MLKTILEILRLILPTLTERIFGEREDPSRLRVEELESEVERLKVELARRDAVVRTLESERDELRSRLQSMESEEEFLERLLGPFP